MTTCWASVSCKIPGDTLRQTSPDNLSVKLYFLHIFHIWDLCCCSTFPILIITQSTLDSHTAIHGTIGNPWNILVFAVRFILSSMFKSDVIHFILTGTEQYIPQDLPIPFVIIFLTCFTTAKHCSTITLARYKQIGIESRNQRFIQCTNRCDRPTKQNQVCLRLRCECSCGQSNPGLTLCHPVRFTLGLDQSKPLIPSGLFQSRRIKLHSNVYKDDHPNEKQSNGSSLCIR
jgi:hypothetical protein